MGEEKVEVKVKKKKEKLLGARYWVLGVSGVAVAGISLQSPVISTQ